MFHKLLITALIFCVLSCGVEEHYYLPQIPDNNITRTSNTEALIYFPAISDEYYYASYYIIFYRIYISDHNTLAYITPSYMSTISPYLYSDYSAFSSITDPSNTTSVTSSNTFDNRNYFKLEVNGADINSILSKDGGSISILFPTGTGEFPVISFNDEQFHLRRSGKLISPEPRNDLSFRNTQELRNYSNAVSNINADVAGRTDTPQWAYVSMYIAAAGSSSNFTTIYSKPTHINVFKLPDAN